MKLILEINLDDNKKINLIKEQVNEFRNKLEGKSTNGVTCNIRVVNTLGNFGCIFTPP